VVEIWRSNSDADDGSLRLQQESHARWREGGVSDYPRSDLILVICVEEHVTEPESAGADLVLRGS
jgi:hypothetical protein